MKKFCFFFEKATAPTAPMWPIPTPMQHFPSASHNLTYGATESELPWKPLAEETCTIKAINQLLKFKYNN